MNDGWRPNGLAFSRPRRRTAFISRIWLSKCLTHPRAPRAAPVGLERHVGREPFYCVRMRAAGLHRCGCRVHCLHRGRLASAHIQITSRTAMASSWYPVAYSLDWEQIRRQSRHAHLPSTHRQSLPVDPYHWVQRCHQSDTPSRSDGGVLRRALRVEDEWDGLPPNSLVGCSTFFLLYERVSTVQMLLRIGEKSIFYYSISGSVRRSRRTNHSTL
jgi:hypothetical protein